MQKQYVLQKLLEKYNTGNAHAQRMKELGEWGTERIRQHDQWGQGVWDCIQLVESLPDDTVDINPPKEF